MVEFGILAEPMLTPLNCKPGIFKTHLKYSLGTSEEDLWHIPNIYKDHYLSPLIWHRDCSVLEIYVLISPFKRAMFLCSSMFTF